jgi:hypothetical protein
MEMLTFLLSGPDVISDLTLCQNGIYRDKKKPKNSIVYLYFSFYSMSSEITTSG